MTSYEELCENLHQQGIEVYEVSMPPRIKGLYCDNVVWLNSTIETSQEKRCVLEEEYSHSIINYGDILDQTDTNNRKQERLARRMAYEKLIPLQSLVEASKEGLKNRYELAEYLDVTEEFLAEAIQHYKEKYGLYTVWTSYVVCFAPLGVVELFEEE